MNNKKIKIKKNYNKRAGRMTQVAKAPALQM
jgi:hypothetical protein